MVDTTTVAQLGDGDHVYVDLVREKQRLYGVLSKRERRDVAQRAKEYARRLFPNVMTADLTDEQHFSICIEILSDSHALEQAELRAALEDERKSHQATRGRLETVEGELAERTAALRRVDARHIQERLEREVAAARMLEREAVAADLARMRAEIATRQSENDELRATKKKLREALERAKAR
jgi:hypothetical protein